MALIFQQEEEVAQKGFITLKNFDNSYLSKEEEKNILNGESTFQK